MEVTEHGRKRIKERAGVGKSCRKALRVAGLAYDRGVKPEEAKGRLRGYLADQEFEDTMSYAFRYLELRVFAGKIWVFSIHGLVTVKPLPTPLWKNYVDSVRAKRNVKPVKASKEQ